MPRLTHQLAESFALDVNESLVIAPFEVDIRQPRQSATRQRDLSTGAATPLDRALRKRLESGEHVGDARLPGVSDGLVIG